MTVSPTRPSGRSGWGLSCFVLGYLGSSILILPLAPRRGAWSSYFPTPKPPGPNPPGTPPIQDPGGPRKPASPLKNKEGGAEPWNPGLGRRPSGGGEAQDTPPAVLSQFLATPPASLASPPPRPRACGTRAPLPQAQMRWLWRWRWPGRGWKPRHPDTHHMQGTGTQAHTDRGLPATQRPPPQTLRNTGRLPGRWPLSLIPGQEPQQEKIVQQDSWSQVWGA